MTRPLTIAIDGPAASGKGTVARNAARMLGYAYVDTGAMYRTVALLATEAGLDLKDNEAVGRLATGIDFHFNWTDEGLRISVGERDVTAAIRREDVGRGASDVATLPAVRAALLDLQRALARKGGVVVDGRDIGTVVLPDADLKIYLDASDGERARRRHAELLQRGIEADPEQVLAEIQARDLQDSSRAAAPLRRAEDAEYLDSTHLTPEQVVQRVVELAQRRQQAPPS